MDSDLCLWGQGEKWVYLPCLLQLSPLGSEQTGPFLLVKCAKSCASLVQHHRQCLLRGALHNCSESHAGHVESPQPGSVFTAAGSGAGARSSPSTLPGPGSLRDICHLTCSEVHPHQRWVCGCPWLCASWGRHRSPLLGVGFPGEPQATPLGT